MLYHFRSLLAVVWFHFLCTLRNVRASTCIDKSFSRERPRVALEKQNIQIIYTTTLPYCPHYTVSLTTFAFFAFSSCTTRQRAQQHRTVDPSASSSTLKSSRRELSICSLNLSLNNTNSARSSSFRREGAHVSLSGSSTSITFSLGGVAHPKSSSLSQSSQFLLSCSLTPVSDTPTFLIARVAMATVK